MNMYLPLVEQLSSLVVELVRRASSASNCIKTVWTYNDVIVIASSLPLVLVTVISMTVELWIYCLSYQREKMERNLMLSWDVPHCRL